VQGKALPGEDLDKAKASFEKVKSQLASAMESEQDYQIVAPFSGMVSRLLVSEGDFVSPRTVLAEIYDPATLVLRTTVNERYATLLKMDMQAAVTLDAYPQQNFNGQISRLYPYLDDRARTRTIEIAIDAAIDLLPGMFGRIRLTIDSIPNTLTIPVNALLVTPQGSSVVFIVRDGKAVQRKVTVGIEDQARLQVLSGVDPGDQIIVSGHENLKDGAEIRLLGAKANAGAGPSSNQKKLEKEQGGDR
jgi:membrane fusion protein (multidrug efflux system)